jgi:hypothetical protein
MKSFEEVWANTRYKYGEDALENVKLGWDLCIAEIAYMFEKEDRHIKHLKSEKARMEDIRERYALAEKYEAEGNHTRADMIRPCCPNEKRNMNGGCDSCHDPCF